MTSLRHKRVLGLPAPDVALAAVLAVYSQLDVFLGTSEWHGNHAVSAAVAFCMAASLAWRRARPLVTLIVPVAGLILLALVYEGSETGTNLFVLLAAVYSVALYGPDPRVAAVIYLIAAVIHTSRTPEVHGAGDWLWEPLMFTLAFAVGLGMRMRTRAHELEQDERVASAAAEERARIARELHDIVSHSLAVMVLQAGAADQVLDSDPARARDVLASIRATGRRPWAR